MTTSYETTVTVVDNSSTHDNSKIKLEESVRPMIFDKWHELVDEFPDKTQVRHGTTLDVLRVRTTVDSDGEIEEESENLVLDFHSSKLFARAMSLFGVSGVGKLLESV